MKIVSEKSPEISVLDMKDGEIGIITRWGSHPSYSGIIIQRFGNHLVAIGEHSEKSWKNALIRFQNLSRTEYVRILPTGTRLEI